MKTNYHHASARQIPSILAFLIAGVSVSCTATVDIRVVDAVSGVPIRDVQVDVDNERSSMVLTDKSDCFTAGRTNADGRLKVTNIATHDQWRSNMLCHAPGYYDYGITFQELLTVVREYRLPTQTDRNGEIEVLCHRKGNGEILIRMFPAPSGETDTALYRGVPHPGLDSHWRDHPVTVQEECWE